MTLVNRKRSMYHMRPSNKEPEWSSICNNVFDQYLDSDDLFAIDGAVRERSSSDGSGNLFDFSGSSEQSAQTNITSPIPSWSVLPSAEHAQTETRHPKAKAPGDFWTKKLRALEQNAAECEERQHRLRTAKSHPDFLSLGGHPSPPAIPQSPTNQSQSARRSRSRVVTANGKRPSTQRSVTATTRSVSRGRPVGVTKPPAVAAVHPCATVRKSNASPSKMMTPSRYRAGFKDVWAERIEHSPQKYELRLPSSAFTFPDSPPPSARSTQDAFAAFGSPIASYPPLLGCDDQISPLANTFQQSTRLYTPNVSPLISPLSHGTSSYFEAAPPQANPYTTQSLPLNDTAPLYPERGSSLAANRVQQFDFGFSTSPEDAWTAAPFAEPSTAAFTADLFDNQDPFGELGSFSARTSDSLGLGISCDPNALSNDNYTTLPNTSRVQDTVYQPPPMSSTGPFYVPSHPHGLPISPTRHSATTMPNTPHRRSGGSSRSPSPPTSRRASGSRRTSRHHRRTKSSSSAPRVPQGADKGGFVNFTPHDSGKILSGVAPSGSSKTKARREKEAADKRRKLNQAALRAVIDAGGSVEALEKAGLIA